MDRTRLAMAWLVALTLAAMLAGGCDRREGQEITLAEEESYEAPPTRIVSLAPAITRMLVDLGLEKQVVGVGEYDTSAPQGTPVVGNFLEINAEALLAAKPTHVLTMAGKSGTPDNLKDLAAARDFQLVVYPVPENIDGVTGIIFDERELLAEGQRGPNAGGPKSLGTLFGMQRQASELKYRLLMQLAAVEKLVGSRPRPRVLMVLGTQPLMASGPGTVHDRLLLFAGGINAAESASVGAPVFDREALIATVRPDVIVLLIPQAPPLQPLDQDDRLTVFRQIDVPAVTQNRIVLINDPLVLLPSSSMSQVAAAMAKAIHPELGDAIQKVADASFEELSAQIASEPLPTPPSVDLNIPAGDVANPDTTAPAPSTGEAGTPVGG